MADIYALVRISAAGVPRTTMEAMVQSMKIAGDAVLESPAAAGQEAEIIGTVKEEHEPLLVFFTGELA